MANSNSNGLVLDVPAQDGNGSCCEACRSRGDLLHCSSCPAVFHAECVGYGSAKDVPAGDWLCWFCAQDKGEAYEHPTAYFQQREGQDIMLAVDAQAKVFCRTKLLNATLSFYELSYMDKQGGSEIISRASPRLWQGTCDKAAWTADPDGVHWRPNSRLYRPGEQRPAAVSPTGAISPSAVTAGGSAGRGKLRLNFKGLRRSSPGDPQQQQQQQQASSDRPPAGPQRLSVPPSPSQAQGGDPAGVRSPDGSAGGSKQASPGVLTVAAAGALESVRRRGVACIPAGEVGAGLPVVQGGASKAEFDEAMSRYWVGHKHARLPSTITIGGNFIDPWVFWREVWAWGGPDAVNEHRLWATIGHSFLPLAGATSMSTRMKTYYDSALGPMDEAVDAGVVQLLRPKPSRLPSDRHLQARVVNTLRSQTSLSNLQAAATGSREASPAPSLLPAAAAAPGRPAAAAAAEANGDADRDGDGDGMQQQPRKRQRQRQRQEQRPKRKRADKWSDNDEGDVILAESSSDESDDGRLPSSDEEEGEAWQQRQRQQQQQQHKRLQEVSSSTVAGAAGSRGSPKRNRVNMSQLREGMLADGLGASGCYDYLRQPTDLVVLGRIQLTPAALAIQVGDCVDFRQPSSSGGHVTGWRSGIVLAIAPGSDWEGGRRLLIKPRHAAHTHAHAHHLQLHGGTPSLPSDSPAAAALAAVAAAGGPTGGSAAEAAAQKLLTPSGHLRHEVAALLPTRSGSLKLGTQSLSGGDTATPPPPAAAPAGAAAGAGPSSQQQQQQQGPAGASGSAEDSDQPRWVAMVWRGDCWDPFLSPPVLVRPHYAPNTVLVAGGSSNATATARAAAGEDSGTSPFSAPQQQRGQQQRQQQRQRELRVGAQVEVLRDGCWCPAQVLEVMPGSSAAGAGGNASGGVVVLRSMAPPEADGSVWRCSGTHPIRPLHPRYSSGCGVVHCSGPDELVTLGAMRKALAPYMYSEGIHAFACLDHMRAAYAQAVAS